MTVCLGGIYKCGKRLAQRGKPLAVVNKFRKLQTDLLLVVERVSVQAQLFKLIVCVVKDCAARSLINAAALHADKSVLYDIRKAYAVLAAELVKRRYNFHTVHFLAVDGGRLALFKMNRHIGGLVRGLLRGNAELKEARVVVLRLVCRIFKVKTLMGQMPEVLILGVVCFTVDLQRDVVCFRILDLFFSGFDAPHLATER